MRSLLPKPLAPYGPSPVRVDRSRGRHLSQSHYGSDPNRDGPHTSSQSHYLFEDRFGRPGKGNDKGKVEGLVGYARRNFLVPVPSFPSFDALNVYLEERCLERLGRQLRGHRETIGQRMERDLEALLPLPAVPYDASDKHVSRVSSLSLVRYRTNDYSVPVAYGHREVVVRGYVGDVVISCGAEVIARHPRSYERDDFVFDPVHYLPLLERKTGALDQAAPLAGWELPEEFGVLRRLLESMRELLGLRPRQRVPAGTTVELWLGISTDEAIRMKPSRDRWITNRYPLIEVGMSRRDCADWWAARYDRPLERSACVACPFQSRQRWVETKRRWPELFAEAVGIDARMRGGLAFAKEPYLHSLRMPLAEAVALDEEALGADGLRDGFGNECEGHCGV